ncbi:hypothetical protein [Wolbachia endosymbiont of Folsomia candida]|uniref:hypothetical protein n=1 Tax=Wolbachia endosymbiont of Folsomia candida TaxID=169402 RepID=UPI000ABC3B52|nr:hypothetical protein [Wolbachia endosymbiont of Folsomia candida]APR98752.1 hypothetical protein ASM33_05955 [Wolbachia endosymbiont of Folsomia candida]
MAIQTKCAEFKRCDTYGEKMRVYLKAILYKGHEQFTYDVDDPAKQRELCNLQTSNRYVKVVYDTRDCNGNLCPVMMAEPVKDRDYYDEYCDVFIDH